MRNCGQQILYNMPIPRNWAYCQDKNQRSYNHHLAMVGENMKAWKTKTEHQKVFQEQHATASTCRDHDPSKRLESELNRHILVLPRFWSPALLGMLLIIYWRPYYSNTKTQNAGAGGGEPRGREWAEWDQHSSRRERTLSCFELVVFFDEHCCKPYVFQCQCCRWIPSV